MSAFGKGRGRGFDVKDAPLRRPGQPFSSKFNDLINLVGKLSIDKANIGTNIDDIVQHLSDAIQNNSIEEVLDDLHKQALEDRQFGMKLSLACSDPNVYSIDDKNFRRLFLGKLQNDYEEREEIRKKSIFHYRNAVSLFGQVFNDLTINGQPILFIAAPLLHHLELLLETSEEEDVELVTTQIFINGQKIRNKVPVELEDFIKKVKLVLVNRNLSARSRGMLLFIIDFAAQNYKPLPAKLKEFYLNEVNNEILSQILRPDVTLTDDVKVENNFQDVAQTNNKPKIKPIPQPVVDNSVNASLKTPRQGKPAGFEPNEKSPPNVASERPMPRAIRGAGAADSTKDRNTKKSPRGKKDKLTDEQIWSSKHNTNSKVWGHDDRFEKDYD